MSTDIRIKRGSGTTPTLADGELGFNKDNKILSIDTDAQQATFYFVKKTRLLIYLIYKKAKTSDSKLK